ncbi:MAG: 2Fe-2S iron-sulfur cluster-binding protein [Pseudomonadota bacterium]
MTALELLGYVASAVLLQLGTGIGAALWRRRGLPAADHLADATPRSDSPADAWQGWRAFRVSRRVFEDAGQTQCSFYLVPQDGLALSPFRPGQYLTFSLNIPSPAAQGASPSRRVTRCYSLSDAPDASGLRVTIKRALPPTGHPEIAPGIASNYFHDRVHEGDILQVRAPSGRFFIDPDPDVPAVFVAGGIGITPMMSMLRWCLAEQPQREVHLYYGVRNGSEHAFRAHLQDLARAHPTLHLTVAYSTPRPEDRPGQDYHHEGHVDLDLLGSTLPHGRHQFYICGPTAMMRSLVPALTQWGVQAGDIHFEAFGPASLQAAAGQQPGTDAAAGPSLEIGFKRSGRTLAWDGQDANLLDFAERHGVAIDSGCRSGSCGSCETRVLSGAVQYRNRPDYDVAGDCCLPCVATPQSALVLEA